MSGELMLVVREEDEVTQLRLEGGTVKAARCTAKSLCDRLGVTYVPMTADLEKLELYAKRASNGKVGKVVTMGDAGTFLLVRVSGSGVINEYGTADLKKPIRLSPETIEQLARIFGNNEATRRTK
jgi:hypothetical protein